jgi:hypothetical protein
MITTLAASLALLTFFFPWMLFSFLDLAAEKSS